MFDKKCIFNESSETRSLEKAVAGRYFTELFERWRITEESKAAWFGRRKNYGELGPVSEYIEAVAPL